MPSVPNARRRVVTLCLAVLASVGVVFAVATPAYAWNVDRPRVTDPGVDFGGSVWAAGAPVGSGHLYWNPGPPDYDVVTPELDGTIHLDNIASHCGRMHISYWDDNGNHLYTDHGGSVCTNDNGHHSWHVNRSAYSSEDIAEVHVCTELKLDVVGAEWDIIGCDTMIKDLTTQ